jgi:hypothetical protein
VKRPPPLFPTNIDQSILGDHSEVLECLEQTCRRCDKQVASPQMAPYVYQPLNSNSNSDEIRLLTLYPGRFLEESIVSIKKVGLTGNIQSIR